MAAMSSLISRTGCGSLQGAPAGPNLHSSQQTPFRGEGSWRSVILGRRVRQGPKESSSKICMTLSSPQTSDNPTLSALSTSTEPSRDDGYPDLPPQSVIDEATRFGVSFPKRLFEFSGKRGWGKRGDPWQHHFGLPTAPGEDHSATYPQYDVTLNNIGFHKSFGHLFATLNFLLPTVLFWNDPSRRMIVYLLAFCTAQTAFEHVFHIVTNQIHFVHLWKQIPILGAGALALYHGAYGAAQAGPRDLLFFEWWYFLTVFVGGTIFEGFVTHFGQYWPVKAPGSI